MSGFHVYNLTKEEHDGDNVFYCGRGSILGNPFTHIKDKETKAKYIVGSREEAIDRYSSYFDIMYGSNVGFTRAVDRIYARYKSGEDVYLGCYCKPQACHCDVIASKLRKRLIKEKIRERVKKTHDVRNNIE